MQLEGGTAPVAGTGLSQGEAWFRLNCAEGVQSLNVPLAGMSGSDDVSETSTGL